MKTRNIKLAFVGLFTLSLAFVSCKKKEGLDGADGKDGNANVKVIMIDSGTTWSGSLMSLSVPEITQAVMSNYAVVGYAFSGSLAYPIPGPYSNGVHIIRTYMTTGNYTLRAHDWDGTAFATPSAIDSVKLVLIEGTKSSSVELNTEIAIKEMEAAGVNVADPNSVIRYLDAAKKN